MPLRTQMGISALDSSLSSDRSAHGCFTETCVSRADLRVLPTQPNSLRVFSLLSSFTSQKLGGCSWRLSLAHTAVQSNAKCSQLYFLNFLVHSLLSTASTLTQLVLTWTTMLAKGSRCSCIKNRLFMWSNASYTVQSLTTAVTPCEHTVSLPTSGPWLLARIPVIWLTPTILQSSPQGLLLPESSPWLPRRG